MVDYVSDFIRQFQVMVQQFWEQWMCYLQQVFIQLVVLFGGMGIGFLFVVFVFGMGVVLGVLMNDVFECSFVGIKGYFEWMQCVVSSQVDLLGSDWQVQMQ